LPDFEEEARIVRELIRSGSGPDPFSSAVRATRMPMLITDPRQPDNPIVFANAAFARLTGYRRADIIGQNCRFLQGPATDRDEVTRLRAAIKARETIELELLNYKKDGETFWNRLLVSPVFNDDGQLTYFFASQFDVTLQRERLTQLQHDRDSLEEQVAVRMAELRASEELLRFALEAGRLGSWRVELATQHLTASDECKRIFGRDPADQMTLEDLRTAIHPDDRERQREAIDRAVNERSLLDIEYRLTTPAGEERWVQIRGQSQHAPDGSPVAIVGTSQDVTERRRAEEHRTLLAHELRHRVKNTLTSLQAVVAQTLRRADTLEDAADTLEARIQAMARVNDLLIQQQFEGASMRDLLARTLAPFGIEEAERFRLDGPEVHLPPRLVVAYALAIHELATNATKYGALTAEAGRIDLRWTVAREGSHRRLDLVWEESGGPAVAAPDRTGFGTQLIQRVLAKETGGSADIDYAAAGVRFRSSAILFDAVQDELALTA
jgi:PAS domain S-box-containing protein